ncbi:hypothetical protein PhaeoP23_01774 [Phaeobacter piscinae]|uniref:Immunity MXAN-0049 protein domain-containing protein n=1 Tax=Phaeobacter piscinae TaxID=1580596 RepID=A0ABN5DFV6_9RHOB|nr:DUF1629 domain-containing protein [Phaeobacter piscinae]ATG35916.1 hypothetical protein PhaeoP36_01774 [Phaeobacter piscinae]AUQ86437.1 hypothetical protein PhaeoP42_01775 [Phaeobacter piscinae]AUR24320.1 hypothetical protein PhaeoP23_01774 [Phaeobacter piscinae]
MVYAMAGGNTDYDPTLDVEPGNFFEGMDGKLRAAEVADLTPDGGVRIGKSSWHKGRSVKVDENFPTKLKRSGPGIKRAKLLDVNRQTGSLDLVNQTFKDIVEEFEPGMHQFFPMEYYDSKGKVKIGDGYWMVICQRLDTLHDTLCVPPRNDRGFIDKFNEDYKDRNKSLDRIVFDKEKVSGHHMWHDEFLSMSYLFSDTLAERLIGAGLTGLSYRKLEEA